MEQTRTLPEQVLLRRSGFLEAKPHVPRPVSVLDELEDTGALGGRNRARADLHVIEISCVQPTPDEDDSEEDEDEAYLGDVARNLPCVLTVDLENFRQQWS